MKQYKRENAYQKYEPNDALKRYAIRTYKADITGKECFYKLFE